ncbi:MAG: glycoside hydrolase family 127 protein, partial [Alistipes sp.]|nr:glycoside hydrolase family 127 protein [Candidatus Minthomonas equi]
DTDYPFSGDVRLRINPARSCRFTLKLRIPTWAGNGNFIPGGLYTCLNESNDGIIIKVNGTPVHSSIVNGFAEIDRKWKNGDTVELSIPMPVRYVTCDERVEENRNTTAVTRGPLVYCAEEPDNGCKIQELAVRPCGDATVSVLGSGILKGIPAIDCRGNRGIRLIPYFAWNNRGDSQSMMIWLKNE